MNRRIVIYYLEFGTKRRDDLKTHLLPFIERVFPRFEKHLIIVDNSNRSAPFESSLVNVKVISGENSTREFSGWQHAFETTKHELRADDTLLFVNDTFASNYGSNYLRFFDQREVHEQLNSGAAVGYCDSKVHETEIFGLPIRSWLRTSFFIIKKAQFDEIGSFLLPVSENDLFPGTHENLFSTNSSLNDHLKKWIEHWLVLGPQVEGETNQVWHSATQLTDQNRGSMEQKAKCVLCELYLSARLRSLNIKIFDVRKSKNRAFGLFAIADSLGILETLRAVRRKLS